LSLADPSEPATAPRCLLVTPCYDGDLNSVMPSQETFPRPSCVVCRERACLWGVDDRAHLCATCNRTVHSTSEDPRQPVRALLESTSTSMSSDSLYDVSVVPDIFYPDARNRDPPNPAQVRPERSELCDLPCILSLAAASCRTQSCWPEYPAQDMFGAFAAAHDRVSHAVRMCCRSDMQDV